MSSSETRAIKRGRQRLDRSTVPCRVGDRTPFPTPRLTAPRGDPISERSLFNAFHGALPGTRIWRRIDRSR